MFVHVTVGHENNNVHKGNHIVLRQQCVQVVNLSEHLSKLSSYCTQIVIQLICIKLISKNIITKENTTFDIEISIYKL